MMCLDPMDWQARLYNMTQSLVRGVSEYIDIDYAIFLKWLMSPIILTFLILPCVILVLIYVSALVLYIYRVHRRRLIRRLTEYAEAGDIMKGGREIVATIWDSHAWLWHGYELKGLENLPQVGSSLMYILSPF